MFPRSNPKASTLRNLNSPDHNKIVLALEQDHTLTADMAPATEKEISNADADFLFHVLVATEELKVNWKAVAASANISAYNNALVLGYHTSESDSNALQKSKVPRFCREARFQVQKRQDHDE